MLSLFWAPDTLIDRVYSNLTIKGSWAQKERPNELLRMFRFDEKVYLDYIFEKEIR